MTKQDAENFQNSIKCWICDHIFVTGDVKVRGHCHVTGKYRGDVQRDCNIRVSLNCKISIMFDNLKNYDAFLIISKTSKIRF